MKTIKVIGIVISLIIFSFIFSSISFATTKGTVNTDTLNLRKEASKTAAVLSLLNQGDEVEILEESGDWYKIKVNNVTGYVHKDYIDIEENDTIQTSSTVDNNTSNNDDNTNTDNIADNQEKDKKLGSNSYVYILPLVNATKLEELSKDTKIKIVSGVNGWSYIQTDAISGWIRTDKIVDDDTTTVQTNANATNQTDDNNTNTNNVSETKIDEKTMYVNTTSIYIRKGPGTNYEIVDSLILNSQVTVIAESGDWYKVKVSEKEGYVAKRLLSNQKQEETNRSEEERNTETENTEVQSTSNLATSSSKGQEIVAFAQKYLGCKYVYGGSGPSTFDCSGFTMYVYKNFGVSLSHSATAQSKVGTYVDKSDLQPGDLVFFKDYETMAGIGHCGIYVGDGNFIHASSGTGYCVKISTLTTGSYNTRYVTARRVI